MAEPVRRRRLPGHERRESILKAALNLFGRRSYDSVGMRDVAAACGMSATGIYRHFASKEALLVGLCDRLNDQIAVGMRTASRAGEPEQVLAELIRFHVRQVLDEPVLIPLYLREETTLPEVERDRFRTAQRSYLAMWTEALLRVRPGLAPAAARATVTATFGLMNSPGLYRSALSHRALERLLIELAARTLGISATGTAAVGLPTAAGTVT